MAGLRLSFYKTSFFFLLKVASTASASSCFFRSYLPSVCATDTLQRSGTSSKKESTFCLGPTSGGAFCSITAHAIGMDIGRTGWAKGGFCGSDRNGEERSC